MRKEPGRKSALLNSSADFLPGKAIVLRGSEKKIAAGIDPAAARQESFFPNALTG
jgi:hypothetical protein